jgi:hypothetical protein
MKRLLVVVVAACGAPGHPEQPAQPCARTPLTAAWAGSNREALTELIDAKACSGHPVATFDWDNTVVKNDVGDATTFYALAHDSYLRPASWRDTSKFLTDAAIAELDAACGHGAPGTPLPTAETPACTDEILSIYDGKTRAGAPAFAGAFDHRRLEPAYAWTAQLLAGHTADEVRALASAAIDASLAAPEGAMQTLGTSSKPAWLRIYDQQRELIAGLHARGFDVWVITASPQQVVQAISSRVGIPADHVIGIRMIEAGGKLTARLAGCGPSHDGDDTIIPYIEGKRCWVNKVVFGDDTPHAIERRPDGQRQTFAAGDAESDTAFVGDAAIHLVIDRHKEMLMCSALRDADGAWIVNPLFLDPMPVRTAAYPCASTSCWTTDGTPAPCTDHAGATIPDQAPKQP